MSEQLIKLKREAIQKMIALYNSPHLKHEESAALRIVIDMAEKYLEIQKRAHR